MKYLIIASLISFSLNLHGQTDYVVTLKGDTLKGKINVTSALAIDELAIRGEDGKYTVGANLVEKAVIKDILYKPVNYENTKRMAQVILEGQLSHIALRLDGSSQYDKELLLKSTGEYLVLSKIIYKNNLINFLSECTSLVDAIENGSIRTSKTDEIVNHYNSYCSNDSLKISSLTIPELAELILRVNLELKKGQSISPADLSMLMNYYNSDLKSMLKEFMENAKGTNE